MEKKIIYLVSLFLLSILLYGCNLDTKNNETTHEITGETSEDISTATFSSIILDSSSLQVSSGEKIEAPSSNVPVSFISQNKDIAYFLDGYIYGVTEGETTMIVKANNHDFEDVELNIIVEEGSITEINDFTELSRNVGRNDLINGEVYLYQSASSVTIAFVGTKVELLLYNESKGFGDPYISYLIDDEVDQNKNVISFLGEETLTIDNLEYGYHTIKILKRNEQKFTTTVLKNAKTDGYFTYDNQIDKLKIEVYGDSITCGYSIYGDPYNNKNTSALDTYAYQVAKTLNADLSVFASSGIGLMQSGETYSNMFKVFDKYHQNSGKEWDFTKYVPDIVIINLGTNDLWSGCSKTAFEEKYIGFINDLKEKYPDTIILCVGGMMTDGLNEQIEEAALKGSSNCYFIALPKAEGTRHPIASEHLLASKVILDFIEANNLLS